MLRRDFTTLSRLVNEIPVYDVVIPWGPPFDPTVAPALANLLGDAAASGQRPALSAEQRP